MAEKIPHLSRGLFVACLLVALSARAIAQTPTTSELLQRGIYLQETVGDLDGAIKIYRQIIQMAHESRANAAEAEYRLGVCLQKKGQHAEADSTFQKLVKDHPEQAQLATAMRTGSREDCVSFNPATAATTLIDGHWRVMDGLRLLFDLGDEESEAKRTLEVIRHYGMNQSCFVARPRGPFKYLLTSGAAPVGFMPGEDCDSFDPSAATVIKDGDSWKIADGALKMFDFGLNRLAANQALNVIKLHGFTEACFVARPHTNFFYMKAPAFSAQGSAMATTENPQPADAEFAAGKLTPVVWTDGVVLEYATARKGSSRSSKTWYFLQSSRSHPGRWLFEERASGTYYRLEFDSATMKPIESFELAGAMRVQVSYKAHVAQIVENNGKRLAQLVLSDPVFEQRELPILLSRLPWARGYQVKISLLSAAASDRVFSYDFSLAGEEDVETPAGSFHCFQIERYLTGQTSASEKYWISTDPAHLLVKSERGEVVEQLSAPPSNDAEESVYHDDSAAYTVNVPAGWVVDKESSGWLYDLHSPALASVHLCPCATNASTPENLRQTAEKRAKDDKYYTVRPQSWQARKVDGRAAVSWIGDSTYSTVSYKVMVMTDSPTSVMLIVMDADAKSFAALRPSFDEMIDSLVLK